MTEPPVKPPSPPLRTDVFSLEGKTAIITGGASGIGAAITRALAGAGARIAFTYRSEETREGPVAALAAEIEELTGKAPVAARLELRSLQSIRESISAIAEQFGSIDILVNSAGTNVQQFALDVDEDTWDLILDTNLKGLFFCSQAVARIMQETPHAQDEWRSIVNVASQMGVVGGARRAAYCSSKAGVVNLTRALAIEWASIGVRVNAVAPTFINTRLAAPMLADAEFRKDVLERSPMGVIGEPEDVAHAVVYLCSSASRLVTGHTLLVDGGWTAW